MMGTHAILFVSFWRIFCFSLSHVPIIFAPDALLPQRYPAIYLCQFFSILHIFLNLLQRFIVLPVFFPCWHYSCFIKMRELHLPGLPTPSYEQVPIRLIKEAVQLLCVSGAGNAVVFCQPGTDTGTRLTGTAHIA